LTAGFLPLQRPDVFIPPLLGEEVLSGHELEAVFPCEGFCGGAEEEGMALCRGCVDSYRIGTVYATSDLITVPDVILVPLPFLTPQILLAMLQDGFGEKYGVLDMLEPEDACRPLRVPPGYHNGRLELLDTVPGEYGALAGVEERVVLEEGDGIGCYFKGGGEGARGGCFGSEHVGVGFCYLAATW
jgi:hypothetical protein